MAPEGDRPSPALNRREPPPSGEIAGAPIWRDVLVEAPIADAYQADANLHVIRMNSSRLAALDPALQRFLLAHERAHLARGDRVPGREAELAADWRAGQHSDPDANRAAWRFFRQQGAFTFDRSHPAGWQRAARIADCAYRPSPLRAEPSVHPVEPEAVR